MIEVVTGRGLVPFLDMAYQGFGDGIEADGDVVRLFAQAGGPLFVSNSFSKSFSLYGERVGALEHRRRQQGRSRARAVAIEARGAHQLLQPADARRPSGRHGARQRRNCAPLWEEELAGMRVRIREMRQALVQKLKAKAPATISTS